MKRIVVMSLVLTAFILNSCIKEMDVFIPDAGQFIGPDTNWYTKVIPSMPVVALKRNISVKQDVDSIQNETASDIVSPSGLECRFGANTFVDANGYAVEGKIAVATNLLLHKGDFIKMSNPTLAGDKILVSGGAFFVEATHNGNPLKLAGDKNFVVRYAAVNTYPNLYLFNGDESDIEKFSWLQNTDTANGRNKIMAGLSTYEITSNKLRWMNCLYELDTTGSKCTNISVTLPPTYTNANTVVYLVFNNYNSVVGLYGNKNTKSFLSGRIPVGKSVKVVTITKEGNLYFLGQQSFVTALGSQTVSGNLYQKITINPAKKSLDSIKEFLSGL